MRRWAPGALLRGWAFCRKDCRHCHTGPWWRQRLWRYIHWYDLSPVTYVYRRRLLRRLSRWLDRLFVKEGI